jgi:GTP cyclohydrolase II
MSNNPGKVAAVEPAGVVVAERAPCIADDIDTRAAYFATKRDKMGHLL